MLNIHEQGSEITHLLRQVTAEYEAAQRGLTGLSYGVSQRDSITDRMEQMDKPHT